MAEPQAVAAPGRWHSGLGGTLNPPTIKTVKITDAPKDLGKWLQAAARGEDTGVISGADVMCRACLHLLGRGTLEQHQS